MGIYNDLVFTEALDQVQAIIASSNTDEVADRLERIAAQPDMAMACLMLLVVAVKGTDITQLNGIEVANVRPSIADLILPSSIRPR